MKPKEFIYKSVYSGCISAGIPETASRDQAECATIIFSKHQYDGKPSSLIDQQIKKAKAINKKQRKS